MTSSNATLLVCPEGAESAALKSSFGSPAENDGPNLSIFSTTADDAVSEHLTLALGAREKGRAEIYEAVLILSFAALITEL
jgi:hypothetical protein